MGSRRRSYIVLGLVLVLIVASVYAVTSKPTRQGIDLAGGTELVYQARATGANTTINVEDVDRSVDLIRDRVDALGVAEPEITRIGERPDLGQPARGPERPGRDRSGGGDLAALVL